MDQILSNGSISAVISSRGAELQSLQMDGLEYLWQGDPVYWTEHSPLLFPYVGRFTEGKYTIEGMPYSMKIHGFASECDFSLESWAPDRAVYLLTDSEKTLKCYPFRFELRVEYRLDYTSLRIRYEVLNLSGKTMIFGIGGHPGFRVPLEEKYSFDEYCLDFGFCHQPTRIGHTPACFLSGPESSFPLKEGRYLPLRHDLFDDDAIVLKNMSRSVKLQAKGSEHFIRVDYPDMPYLGIWHCPKTEAPYVCIEPWTSLPSRQGIIEEFQTKSDLTRLKEGETYVNEWAITLG